MFSFWRSGHDLAQESPRDDIFFTKGGPCVTPCSYVLPSLPSHMVWRQGVGHGLRNPHLGIGGWRLVIGEWQP
jgi:hypothetical protein